MHQSQGARTVEWSAAARCSDGVLARILPPLRDPTSEVMKLEERVAGQLRCLPDPGSPRVPRRAGRPRGCGSSACFAHVLILSARRRCLHAARRAQDRTGRTSRRPASSGGGSSETGQPRQPPSQISQAHSSRRTGSKASISGDRRGARWDHPAPRVRSSWSFRRSRRPAIGSARCCGPSSSTATRASAQSRSLVFDVTSVAPLRRACPASSTSSAPIGFLTATSTGSERQCT